MVGRLQFVLHHEPSGEAYGVWSSYGLRPWPSAGTASLASHRFSIEFPYSELRARLTGVSTEDWLREARLGLLDALHTAIFMLEDPRSGLDLRRNRDFVEGLADLTGYDGPLENTPAWLAAHATQLQYDHATGHYRVQGGR